MYFFSLADKILIRANDFLVPSVTREKKSSFQKKLPIGTGQAYSHKQKKLLWGNHFSKVYL